MFGGSLEEKRQVGVKAGHLAVAGVPGAQGQGACRWSVGMPLASSFLRGTTYAAMRLQTTDSDQAVSPYTVMRELGHSSIGLIEKTYGHLLNVRHRADVVEYREADVVDLQRKRA